MGATNIKDEARRLVEKLPENSTWDDLMHEIYVRQAIEQHLASMLAHAQPVPQDDRLVHVEELTVALPE